MTPKRRAGLTLVELAIVLAIIAVTVAAGAFGISDWFEDNRVKAAARSVADAFLLARAEAIRTGNNHLVVFQGALNATAQIEIANDGPAATADCDIDPGETVHQVAAIQGVGWGTTVTGANGTPAPDDPGLSAANVASGSSFTDASLDPTNPATWVLFQGDGLPRPFTPNAGTCQAVGRVGQGGGAIYVSNGRRDYAIVLSHLGATRVHVWDPGAGAWRN